MKYIREWKQREFIAKVSGVVADNMYAACSYAAEQARALAPVRSGKMKKAIDIVVEVAARGNTIEGIVGVRKQAFWAWFQEMGTRHHPAHPFLRPAVFGHAAEIVRILCGGR
jgi:HK97 gp10 family phage protein